MSFCHISVPRWFLCASAFWACTCFAQTPAKPPEKPEKPSPIMQSVDPSEVDAIQKYPPCAVNAPAGYRGGNCRIQIWRSVPISPPTTLSLPAGTHVYVELFEARQNESVAFTLSTQATGPHQVGPSLLPTVIPGLNTITFSSLIPSANQQRQTFLNTFGAANIAKVPPPAQQLATEIEARQTELVQKTNDVLIGVQNASVAMNCLSSYETLVAVGTGFKCSQAQMLSYDDFPAATNTAFDMIKTSTALPLRINDVSDLDSVVKAFYLTCLSYFPNMGREAGDTADKFCRGNAEALSTREGLLDVALTDIQKADDVLIQNKETLAAWVAVPTSPKVVVYEYTPPSLTNLTIAIAGTEVVSKTASPIATVTINAQAIHVVVSTGIAFSNLRFNTFTSSPVYANGMPVLNPDGSVKTQVHGTATDFSVIAPIALVSYRINRISDFKWETRCPGSCSFLLSGGVGANLTAKEADFDVGASFEIAGILFTPALHFGSDVRLANGLYVGEPLGSNPPSPLPTTNKWVRKAAFAITYSIPIPNF
jgi:hypothetical protein